MDLQIIQNKIFEVRGCRVMLDFHLAELYQVETRALKQAVKRNLSRFPSDFAFQLTKDEWQELITNCDKFPENIRHTPIPPLAFLEQGVAMLSSVLRSQTAIDVNISIMRAFVLMRQMSIGYEELLKRIEELEQSKRGIYGGAIGYLDFAGNLDTCIAIRTAFKKNGKVFVRSGAGIVADSVPEKEYQECLNKAAAVVRALELAKEVTE